MDFRKQILRRVLEAQEECRLEGPEKDIVLISDDELHEIRRMWRTEEGDWEDSIPLIYHEVTGEHLDWVMDADGGSSAEEHALLQSVADEHELPLGLLKEMVDLERNTRGMSRRSGVFQKLTVRSRRTGDHGTRFLPTSNSVATYSGNMTTLVIRRQRCRTIWPRLRAKKTMRFNKLRIENFGLYAGATEFDLSATQTGKPVVLIGGQNGAGKTTFLEAIRLCMYGRLSLDKRVSKPEYDRYLEGRIHRNQLGQPATSACLTLVFDYATDGQSSEYEVTRRWSVRDTGKIVETFTLLKNGQRLTNVSESHWEEFVENLVPIGVSQLFFFDGEKIKELADEDTGMVKLADAMKSMLGLDLVERLRADLTLYRNRKLADMATGDLKSELALAETELAELAAQEIEFAKRVGTSVRIGLHDRHNVAGEWLDRGRAGQEDGDYPGTLQIEHANALSQIATIESVLVKKGGLFAEERETNEKLGSDLQGQINEQRLLGRQLMETPLAFAFCPKLAQDFRKQLKTESQSKTKQATAAEIKALKTKMLSSIDDLGTVEPSLREFIGQQFEDYLKMDGNTGDIVHDLSDSASAEMLAWLNQADKQHGKKAHEIGNELERLEEQSRRVQHQLLLAPAEVELTDTVKQLSQAQERALKVELEIEQDTKRLTELVWQSTLAMRKINKMTDQLSEQNKLDQRIELAEKSLAAMATYHERLSALKINELEQNMTRRFLKLARKDDLLKGIRVCPQSMKSRSSVPMVARSIAVNCLRGKADSCHRNFVGPGRYIETTTPHGHRYATRPTRHSAPTKPHP